MIKLLICLSTLFVAAICGCFDKGDKEIGGSCYKFVNQKLSFEDARDWCHYKNPVTMSYLAYVGNQFTANFLASYAHSEFGPAESFFWIGLSRNRTWMPWTWDTGYQAVFTNFGSDQLNQNYAAESITNTKWSSFNDSNTFNFVCSYDPSAPPTFGPPATVGPTGAPTTTTNGVTTPTVPTTTGKK
uniref:C-type lectin domain-containing protein n=1 Tax=Caenorhabditis japonica TaxID=281687 RepID=A0A8R1DP34_CAEJA